MKTMLKWTGIALGTLLLLVLLTIILLIGFVNPNHLKPLIVSKVLQTTGHTLEMDGDLSWTFFPHFGVKTGHWILNNPDGFQQKIFAEAKETTLTLEWLPLFRKKIESNGITLHGFTLYLIKNKKGAVNWNKEHAAPSNESKSVIQQMLNRSPSAIAIAGFHVTNSDIFWIDEQKNQQFHMSQLQLDANHAHFFSPFLVTLTFNTSSTNHIQLSTEISMDWVTRTVSFNTLQLRATDTQKRPLKMDLSGSVTIDFMKKIAHAFPFQGKIGELSFHGDLKAKGSISQPLFEGKIHILPFDMKQWLQEMGYSIPSLNALKKVDGQFIIHPSLGSPNIEGKLNINLLQMNRIKITDLQVPFHYQNKRIVLEPFSGSFYQGALLGQSTIDFQQSRIPHIAIQTNLSRFNMDLLMKDLGQNQSLKWTGEGALDFQIETLSGIKITQWKGTGQFKLGSGVLQGVDIPYWLHMASALFNKKSAASANTHQTHFTDVTGSMQLQNGILSNHDLLMHSSEFTTHGQGTIHLTQQTIQYRLQTVMNSTTNDKKNPLANFPVPIIIEGSLKSPKISVDVNALTKFIATQQLNRVQKHIQEKLKIHPSEKTKNRLQDLLGE